jgi:hypothetical protein
MPSSDNPEDSQMQEWGLVIFLIVHS